MPTDIAPLESVDHARWFNAPLSGEFAVDGVLPPGFDAYVRVLHPAAADDGRPVRWAEVAAAQGTTLHPSAQFAQVARRRHEGHAHGWRGDDPYEGSLDRQTLETLVGVLGAHTTTPQAVWLNLWDGWGQLPTAWADRPLVRDGHGFREYLAFGCALDEVVSVSVRFEEIGWEDPGGVGTAVSTVAAEHTGDGDPEEGLPAQDSAEPDHALRSPQQWWPDDRAWVVATEIDDDYTLVGGTSALVEAILHHPGLEAIRIDLRDSLEDDVNPAPSR